MNQKRSWESGMVTTSKGRAPMLPTYTNDTRHDIRISGTGTHASSMITQSEKT
jgi:hypothetical protein